MALFTLDEFENIVSDQKKINTNENFQRLINAGLMPAQSSTLPTATPRSSTSKTGKADRKQQQLNQRLNNVAKNKKKSNSNLLINPNDTEAVDYSKIYKKNAPTIDTEKLKKDLGADYELFASQGISGGNNPEYIGALGENFLTGVKNVGRNIANAVDSINTTNTKEQRLIQAIDRVRAENPTNQSIEKGIQKAVNNVNPYTVQRQREQESIKRAVERQQRTQQETAKNDEFYGNLPGYGAVKLVGQGVGALAPTIAVNAVAPGAGSAIFATNVYGRAFTEAVGDGATYKQAKQYARLDTALEFATEHLFGGIKNVTPEGSVAGNILNKLDWRNMSDKFVKTDVGRYLFKKVLDVTGEGAEEVISEVVTPFLKRAVYNPDTELADLSDILSAFGGGALVAAVLGAINAPNEFREINNDYYYSKYSADGTSASDMSDVQKWFDGIDDLESARAKYREYVKAYSDVRNSAEADPARAAELASITNGYNTLKTILKNNGANTATASAQTAETATEQPQTQNQVSLLSQGLNGENGEISRADVNVQPTSENVANVLPSVAELERTITNSGVNISPAELDRILGRNTAPAREVSPDISRLEQAAVDSGIKATAEEVRNIRTAKPEQTKKSIIPKTKWKDRLNEILSSDDTDKAKQLERLKDGVKSTPAKNAIQAEIDKIKPATATTANIDTTDLSKMSDEQLQKVDNQFTTEIEKVKDNLAELASRRNVATNEMPKEYYRTQRELTELRNSHRNVTDEISKRKSEKAKAEPAEKKTFVNGYGEATKRYITTATYERWLKKLSKREKRNDKDILRNLGYNPATSRDITTPTKQVNREALEKRLKVAQSEENTTSRVRARRLLVKQGIDWQTGEEMPVKLTAAQVNKIRDIADKNKNKNYPLFSNNGTEYYQDEVLYRLSPDGNIKKALTFAKTGEILNDPNTVKVATVNYNEGVVPDGRTVSEIKARNEKQSTDEQMIELSVYTKSQARTAPTKDDITDIQIESLKKAIERAPKYGRIIAKNVKAIKQSNGTTYLLYKNNKGDVLAIEPDSGKEFSFDTIGVSATEGTSGDDYWRNGTVIGKYQDIINSKSQKSKAERVEDNSSVTRADRLFRKLIDSGKLPADIDLDEWSKILLGNHFIVDGETYSLNDFLSHYDEKYVSQNEKKIFDTIVDVLPKKVDKNTFIDLSKYGLGLKAEQSVNNKSVNNRLVQKLSAAIPELEKNKSVASLTGNEFPKGKIDLVTQVGNYFKSIGGKVTRKNFGDIIIDSNSVKNDMAHGIGRAKSVAFKAVPAVLKNGVQIDFQENWKNRGKDSYVFAAPIDIGSEKAYVCAVVLKDKDQRFYLHEVVNDKGERLYLANKKEPDAFKTGGSQQSGVSRASNSSKQIVPHTAAESQEAGAKVSQNSNKVTEKTENSKSSDIVLKATIPGGNRLESLINQIAKSKEQSSNTEKNIDDMSIEELARELAESRAVINDIIENKDEPKVIKEKLEKHHYKATPQIITKIQSFYGYEGTLPESMTDNEDGILFRTEEPLKPQGRNVKLTKKETKRYNEATEFYGEVQEKKGGAREVQIPKSVEFDENDNLSEEEHKFVSESAKTMAQSPAFSDEYAETMKKAVLDGVLSYEKQENQKTLDKATEKIEELGFSGAYSHWNKVVEGKSTYKLEDFALGVKLMQNAAENNDIKRAVEIASGLQMFSTLGAQTVQFGNVWRKLTPEGRLYTVQMAVNHINRQQASYVNKTVQELADERNNHGKKKGKNKPVAVPPELLEKLMNAGNDLKERERIMEEIEQNIADQLPGTWDEKLRSLRFLGMLGNPRTHVRNFTGNVLMILPSFAKNEVGALLELTIPKEERTKAGLLKLGKTRSKERKEFIDAEFDRYKDMITGNKKYDFKGGIQAKRTIFKTVKPLNTLSKFNSDMLEKEDEMFLKFHFGYQYRMVMARRGLTVNDIKKNDKLRLEIANIAAQEAQINTFRDYNGAAVSISRRKAGLRRKAQDKSKTLASRGIDGVGYAMAEGLLPFTTTPANILRRGIEYSPAGLINGIYQTLFEVKQGKVTAGQAIDKITKGLTGTAIMALGAYFAAKGWVKGQSSDDSKQKTIDKLKGRQEYALQIGDITYTIDWAAPSIMPFLVGANIYQDAMQNDGLTLSKVVDGILAMADTITDLSLLQGINSAIKAVRYNKNAITGTGEHLATSYAGQYVPTLSGQIARTLDPVRRNAYFNDKTVDLPQWVQVFINQQRAKIPGLSQGVVPYVDAWGNIEKQSDNVFARAAENFLSQGYISKINNDPVTNEVERLYKQTGDGACVPSVAEKTITKDGTKINLSGEQWVKYAQEKGQLSHAMVKKAITSADYKSLSDKDKVEVLNKIYSYANEIAKNKTVNTELERTDKDRQILLDSGLNPATLFTRKNQADVDGNDSLSATEVFNYLESRDDIDLYQAMYMFDLLAPSKTKTNPYEVAYYGYDE